VFVKQAKLWELRRKTSAPASAVRQEVKARG